MDRKKRLYYLDLARGLAVFFMIMQHCILVHEYSGGEGEIGFLGGMLLLLGTAPAAPVFMFLMGVLLARPDSSHPSTLYWRGFKLLLLGYLLNLIRFSIPLSYAEASGIQLPEGETPLEQFLAVDILQLAGLSFLFSGFIVQFKLNKLLPIIIVAILILAPYTWETFGHINWTAPLWGTGKNVYFPFFPWAVYALMGMYLSPVFLSLPSQPRNKQRLFFGCCIGLVICIVTFSFFPTGSYQRSGAAVGFGLLSFVILWLLFCLWLMERVSPENPIIQVLNFWSRNVTVIYCVQWVLYGWSTLILDANAFDELTATGIGLIVLLASHLSAKSRHIRYALSWV